MELSRLQEQLCATNMSVVQLETLLGQYIALLEPGVPMRLFEFCMHPVRAHAKGTTSSKVRELSLRGMGYLLKGTKGTTLGARVLQALANDLSHLLADVETSASSEEAREECVKALHQVILKVPASSSAQWETVATRALYGWVLAQLLECITRERSRSLRLEALRCAKELFCVMLAADVRVAASFLPGYLGVLQKVCCGDFKQGMALVECGLCGLGDVCSKLLGKVVVAGTLSDPFESIRNKQQQDVANNNVQMESKKDSPPSFLTDVTSLEWQQTALQKTGQLVNTVIKYVHRTYGEEHDESSARKALLEFCGLLLQECDPLLPHCSRVLCDVVVLYASDEWPQVVELSQNIVASLQATSRHHLIASTARDALYVLTVALPRVVRTLTDAEKLTKLRLVAGYAKFLGPDQLTSALLVSLSPVAEALVQILRVDRGVAKIEITEDPTFARRNWLISQHGSDSVKSAVPILKLSSPLLYCGGSLTPAALNVPFCFGSSTTSAVMLLNHMWERIEEDSPDAAECLLACSQMITSMPAEDGALNRTIARGVETITQLVDRRSDSVVLAFGCYTLGSCALRLLKAFEQHTLHSIPFLLKCLGCDDERLCAAAWQGLECAAFALGHESVDVLIRDNADYVVDKVVRDLRVSRKAMKAEVPHAVAGILRHSPTNATWLLDEILSEVISTLDASNKTETDVAAFVKILREISSALLARSRLVEETTAPSTTAVEDDVVKPPEDEEQQTDQGVMLDDDDEKPTREEAIATKMIDRVRNFVAAQVLEVQLDAIECICNCLQVLSKSQRQLLPAIYSVWDSFMKRFETWDPESDRSCAICARVAQAAAVIASLGQDFLSGEKFERLWKSYQRILDWGFQQNMSRPTFSDDVFFASTYGFRLQLAVLESTLVFIHNIRLNKELSEKPILDSCNRFLEIQRLHPKLEQACKKILQALNTK